MCEEFYFEHEYENIRQHEQSIGIDLAKRFIKCACEKLDTGLCQHYFIDQINILASYNSDLLKQASRPLSNDVDIEFLFSYDVHYPAVENVIRFSPEMVQKYRQFQMNNFDEQTNIYIPKTYDSSLEHLYRDWLAIEENDENWWDKWNDIILRDSAEPAADLRFLTLSDIVSIVFFFTCDLRQRWSVIKYMMFEDDTMKEFIINNRQSFVNYAIRLSERWIYDSVLTQLRDDPHYQIIQRNTAHLVPPNVMAYFGNDEQNPINFLLVPEENLSLRIDIVLDDYWRTYLPNLIEYMLLLTAAGYFILKFMFAIDQNYQQTNPIRARFLPLIKFISLLRKFAQKGKWLLLNWWRKMKNNFCLKDTRRNF
ncbi:unnamed protein product [Didymodactylos carnosus]|uniref:Uncharacterized protein n=1 Tax=Didymodactylos carnosus TaxID=1234261 RepID=A0A813PA74_9BILA|nr:unnamed protein product [Didymodactylos carnosus]CAF0747601.1 unnamed protein product [Didymodactylos carnosus]CAF3502399.1 unnamed protein product [Didymodactylos carnosus]CAF3526669.1 unnamed protein product [Didymodactylos carnosus]